MLRVMRLEQVRENVEPGLTRAGAFGALNDSRGSRRKGSGNSRNHFGLSIRSECQRLSGVISTWRPRLFYGYRLLAEEL